MPNIDYTLRLKDLFSSKLKGAVIETKKADAAVGGLQAKLKAAETETKRAGEATQGLQSKLKKSEAETKKAATAVKGLETKLKGAEKAAKKAKVAVGGLPPKLKETATAARKAKVAVGGLDTKLGGLGRTIGRAGLAGLAIGGAVAIGAGLKKFGDDAFDALKNYEFFSVSLRTLMKGDEFAAKSLSRQLTVLAKTTPFSLQEVQQGARQLLATGAGAGDVTRELTMLGNIASGLNVPLERIILNYGQVRAQGVLMGTELRDFTRAGIPIIAELAKQFGVAESAIKKMSSEGKISFAQMSQAFGTMTGEGGLFFNLMTAQSATVGGKLSNLGDSYDQLALQWGRDSRGMIFDTLTWAEETISAMEESKRAANDMAEIFKGIKLPDLETDSFAENLLQAFINPVGGFFETFDEEKKEALQAEIKREFLGQQGQVEEASKTLKGSTELLDKFKTRLGQLPAEVEADVKRRADVLLLLGDAKPSFKTGVLAAKDFLTKDEIPFVEQLIKNNIKLLEGAVRNLTPKDGGKLLADGTVDEGLGTGVGISGRRPQNINITINKLVETIEIHSETLPEAADEIQDEVAKTLLEAVNDVNSIAK